MTDLDPVLTYLADVLDPVLTYLAEETASQSQGRMLEMISQDGSVRVECTRNETWHETVAKLVELAPLLFTRRYTKSLTYSTSLWQYHRLHRRYVLEPAPIGKRLSGTPSTTKARVSTRRIVGTPSRRVSISIGESYSRPPSRVSIESSEASEHLMVYLQVSGL